MKSCLLSFALVLSLSAFAQNAEKAAANPGAHPCAADVKKFCASVEKGQGRILKCLTEHTKDLSPECSTKMAEGKAQFKEKVKSLMENCKEDAQKLCKDVPAGKGAKIKCLREKKDQTSDKCKAVLP